MKLQQHLQKAFSYKPELSASELSQAITEAAFNTSSLLQNVGRQQADNPSYRNVYVTHPSISDVNEGDDIPTSTVQSYYTTDADFKKVASRIELTNEVINFSKFDIEGNTANLVGTVAADKVAQLLVADINGRFVDSRQVPDSGGLEEVLRRKSGVTGEWGADASSVYEFLADSIKVIPDAYDSNSKLYCNKNNFVDLASLTQDSANGSDQVWLIQNGLLLGRYEIVIVDQLDDATMYFGDLMASFDVVSLFGNQTADPYSKPDVLGITETNKFSFVAKDSAALVAMTQEV